MKANINTLSAFLIVVLTFLLSLSSCGVEFGSDDNGNGGGGGVSTVEGNIEEIIPTMSVEGILVQIMENTTFFDETDQTGSFTIEGDFSGSQTLEFLDANDMVFARFNIIVPSGGSIKLENITIDDGVVEPERIEETFEGEITSLNCTANNSGNLVVSVGDDNFTVVINSGTDIEDEDGDDLSGGCNDLAVTNNIEVEGVLEGGQIVADRITR